ncbi:VOC family protein [Enterococcus sp. LJL120]
MKFRFDHLQITVPDVEKVEPFYDQLFSLLGFDVSKKYKGYLEHSDMLVVEYLDDMLDFGICSPKAEFAADSVNSRKPGAVQHLAFEAESRRAIDEFFEAIQSLEVKILHGRPKEYNERIAPGYYALFFESPDGIRFEIFHY